MDLRDYARTLRKRWALVVLCVLLAVGAAAAATLATAKTYTSSTQLFVSARDQSGAISDAYQGGLFTQQRVKSYAQVADSPAVTDQVADRLDIPPAELAGKVTAEAPLDTVLLNITASDRSPKQAQRIAAAVADEVVSLIPTLETPAGASGTPVKISVIKQASLPSSPSSPRPKINLALGLLVGLALGVGAAVLRETLDTTIKGKEDLRLLTDATPLGVITNDPDVSKRPLVVHVDSQSPRAEAFRQLRTNLQFVDVDHPLRTVVVTSPSAEEGKSTTSCNLAITLAQAGLRTILVEADLRRPRVADYMGLEGAVGLMSVLSGLATLEDALQPWGRNAMWVLASGPLPPNPSEVLGSHQMADLLKSLDDRGGRRRLRLAAAAAGHRRRRAGPAHRRRRAGRAARQHPEGAGDSGPGGAAERRRQAAGHRPQPRARQGPGRGQLRLRARLLLDPGEGHAAGAGDAHRDAGTPGQGQAGHHPPLSPRCSSLSARPG